LDHGLGGKHELLLGRGLRVVERGIIEDVDRYRSIHLDRLLVLVVKENPTAKAALAGRAVLVLNGFGPNRHDLFGGARRFFFGPLTRSIELNRLAAGKAQGETERDPSHQLRSRCTRARSPLDSNFSATFHVSFGSVVNAAEGHRMVA
jgi:hypothetical protein